MNDLLKRRFSPLALLAILAGVLPACGAADDGSQTGDEDDLTSVTARERKLAFDGYVYVSATAGDYEIMSAVRRETKSAFGALRTANISVNDRELKDVDPKTFVKEPVEIVDPKNPSASPKSALRVRYRYTDRALVPKSMAKRGAIGLAMLHGNYQAQSKRILEECTGQSAEDLEFEGSIWYVFNPSLDSCRDAIEAEETAIQKARDGLAKDQIVQAELDRLYLPTTVKLESTKTSKAKTYPEYDRLYSGGVEPGKLVIGLVDGVTTDWASGQKVELYKDLGYHMFYEELDEVQKLYPGLTLVSTEGTNLTTFTANGKTAKNVTWNDLANWELRGTGWPAAFSSWSDRDALRKVVADKLAKHWLSFEQPLSVKIGAASAKPVKLVINAYYGAETDDTPHRRALSTSDVVIYNGHSYIGFGPLDPNRYDSSDFPDSYQILFFNSCVSFNYYEKDFFKMKADGTKDLDMVTNGMETWLNGSGRAMGRFLATLVNGKQASYKDLLTATIDPSMPTDAGSDPLRVVDGEVDNTYKPSSKKIVVTPK